MIKIKRIFSPKVGVGQIWSRPDSNRILVCRINHAAITSSHRLNERVAEIRLISTDPNMLGRPVGPPSYPLIENFPKYYKYEGMREPRRLDLLELFPGTNGSGSKFILVEGLMYYGGLREMHLSEYFPFRKKKFGKRFTQKWNQDFWRLFVIIGSLTQTEYGELIVDEWRKKNWF